MAPRRNSGNNKAKQKGPQTADPNSQALASPATASCSPACNEKLPTVKQNQNQNKSKKGKQRSTTRESVSDLSFTYVDRDLEENTSTFSGNNTNHDGNPAKIDGVSGSSPTRADSPASLEVGDNRENESKTIPPHTLDMPQQGTTCPQQQPPADIFTSLPEDPWHLTYNELKVMRARMGTLEKVEAATLDFAQQLQAITSKAAATESKISSNSDKIKELKEEIGKLRETVDSQQSTIKNLHKIKDEFTKTSHKTVSEMNALLEQQRQQVESLRIIRKDIKADTQNHKVQLQSLKVDLQNQNDQLQALKTSQKDSQESMQQLVKSASEGMEHNKLKDQAFQNRHNIVITGLPENDANSTFSIALKFLKSQLTIKKRLAIGTAYRLGRSPSEGNSYTRPILVKFKSLSDRNLVWRMRNDIPQTDDQPNVKIQADLPKKGCSFCPISRTQGSLEHGGIQISRGK